MSEIDMTTRDELVGLADELAHLIPRYRSDQSIIDAAANALRLASRQEVSVEELAQSARDADYEDGQCLATDSRESYERMARALLVEYSITKRSGT